MKSRIAGYGRSFGHFWWDFLIGDTPEFAVVTVVIVGLAFLLRHEHLAAAVILPLVATGSLLVSAARGRLRQATATATAGPGPAADPPADAPE